MSYRYSRGVGEQSRRKLGISTMLDPQTRSSRILLAVAGLRGEGNRAGGWKPGGELAKSFGVLSVKYR